MDELHYVLPPVPAVQPGIVNDAWGGLSSVIAADVYANPHPTGALSDAADMGYCKFGVANSDVYSVVGVPGMLPDTRGGGSYSKFRSLSRTDDYLDVADVSGV